MNALRVSENAKSRVGILARMSIDRCRIIPHTESVREQRLRDQIRDLHQQLLALQILIGAANPSEIVGSPHARRTLADYWRCLSPARRRFRDDRRAAWQAIAEGGHWPLALRYLRGCWRGASALLVLYAAGWLYALRITAVLDVDAARDKLTGAFA